MNSKKNMNGKQIEIKEFVPYDLALKLKDLGFEESCFGRFLGDKDEPCLFISSPNNDEFCNIQTDYSLLAPTFSQAFKWFRKKYIITSWIEEDKHGFTYNLFNKKICFDFTQTICDEYEEAELTCLIFLIEFVNKTNIKTKI